MRASKNLGCLKPRRLAGRFDEKHTRWMETAGSHFRVCEEYNREILLRKFFLTC